MSTVLDALGEHLNELCCLIIEDTHGSFLSHIFKQLATYGRLSAGQVAQRCHLLLRQAKSGLAALVQLRLVQHHSLEGFSTYQVDLLSTYDLLRTGKLAQLACSQLGPVAGLVIEVLASRGFATAPELESITMQALDESRNSENHYQNGSKASTKVQDTLRRLADNGFISRIGPAHLQIPHDARQSAEHGFQQVTAGGQRGETLRADRSGKVQAELEKRLDPCVSGDALDAALNVPNGDAAATPLTDVLYLCLNFTPLIRSIRDAIVTKHVSKTIGKAPARLATAALKQVDLRTAPFEPSPNPRAEEQQLTLSRLLDDTLKTGITNGAPQTNGYSHGDDTRPTNGVEYEDEDFVDTETLEEGLVLFSEGPYPFVRRDENTAWWYMDRYQLATWLRDHEILNLISARVGPVGMRLVRMLIDKGKLDEKLLQEMGLLSAKEMRQALAELQTLGLIELQEVPREPQRQPNRTIFLWFYDPLRARDLLLGQLYKSMARCYQRLQAVERERMKATLDKIEREDVKDRVEEVVVGPEMVALQQFQAKERWLVGEIARLDDSIALLRDM